MRIKKTIARIFWVHGIAFQKVPNVILSLSHSLFLSRMLGGNEREKENTHLIVKERDNVPNPD